MMVCSNSSFKIPNNSKFTAMLIDYWNNLMNNHKSIVSPIIDGQMSDKQNKKKMLIDQLKEKNLNGEKKWEKRALRRNVNQIWSYAQSVNGCQSRICTRNGWFDRRSELNIQYIIMVITNETFVTKQHVQCTPMYTIVSYKYYTTYIYKYS